MRNTFLTLLCVCAVIAAQAQSNLEYRRNSLATMLVYHPEDEFGGEIYKAFDSLPIPDKYDDHTIAGMRIINNRSIWGVQRRDSGYFKATYGHQLTAQELQKNARHTEDLLNQKQMAKYMVAKWFGLTGKTVEEATFNTKLIQLRGQYNANDVDVALALQTTRGLASLSDAGEELLHNTFVLVNDITYITAEQEAAAAKAAMSVIGGILDGLTGGTGGRDLAKAAGQIADSFTGFKVKTHSYLYQLEWNDSIARTELVRTICARSMDKNIVALAKQYEDFKVKTPVYSVLTNERGKVEGYAAKIGMKEGISETSKFQVVQRIQDPETGKTKYKYVATVKPKKGQIWDNRYNAVLEEADGATLPYTTFVKTAGGEILPGMLLIEGKYRKVTE